MATQWLWGSEFNRRLNDPDWRPSEDPEWPRRFAISKRLLRPIIRHHLGLAGVAVLWAGFLALVWRSGFEKAALPGMFGWAALVIAVQFIIGFLLGAAAERIQWGSWRATLRAGVAWGIATLPFVPAP